MIMAEQEKPQELAAADAEVISVDSDRGRRGSGAALAVLALLLAVALGAAGAYLVYRMLPVKQQLDARIAEMQGRVAEVQGRIDAIRGDDPRAEAALAETRRVASMIDSIDARLADLSLRTQVVQAALAELPRADRDDWLLAEAEYLMRLANQGLLMGREVRGAAALLRAADAVLRDQDDPALHGVRAALAADIARLNEVAEFDVEGVYLRLSALAGRLPGLELDERSMRGMTIADESSGMSGGRTEGWWARLLAHLDPYIVVRRRGEPVEPLLPPGEEVYLRMNLRLLIEQAQLALLAAEQPIYEDALRRAQRDLGGYFSAEVAVNRAFVEELSALAELNVAPPMPDISASLNALRAYNRQRGAREGAGGAAPGPAVEG